MTPRSKPTALLRTSCNTQEKICRRSQIASKDICSNPWDSLRRRGRSRLLGFVDHQFAARSIAFLRHFVESDDDAFAARPGFFDKGIGDPLRDLPLLVSGAALQHGDLDEGHKDVLSWQFSVLRKSAGSQSPRTENWELRTILLVRIPRRSNSTRSAPYLPRPIRESHCARCSSPTSCGSCPLRPSRDLSRP